MNLTEPVILIGNGLDGPRASLIDGATGELYDYLPALPVRSAQSGEIWLARMRRHVRNIGLFVSLGEGGDALIGGDTLPRGFAIEEGACVPVEISRPAARARFHAPAKGPRARLQWRVGNLVAQSGPGLRGVGFARSFPRDLSLRAKATKAAHDALAHDEGVILDGAGAIASATVITEAVRAACAMHRRIAEEAAAFEGKPLRLHRPDPWLTVLRWAARGEPKPLILAANSSLAALWQNKAGQFAAGLSLGSPRIVGEGLFLDHSIAERIDEALEAVHDLGGGATLILEAGAALTSIDVNTGDLAPIEANRRATGKSLLLLRLLRIGGLVAIDYATPGRGGRARSLLLAARTTFEEQMHEDTAMITPAKSSPFGLFVVTREERAMRLADALLGAEDLPLHAGLVGLDRLLGKTLGEPEKQHCLWLHPRLLGAIEDEATPLLASFASIAGKEARLAPDPALALNATRILCDQ